MHAARVLALLAAAAVLWPGGGAAVEEPRPGGKAPEPGGLAAGADDVADYTLTAKLDPALHTVHGEGTIAWRNASAVYVKELWLHLYLNAFKNERSVFMREPVGHFRGAVRPREWGAIDVRKLVWRNSALGPVDLWPAVERSRPGDDDETDARVPLPREVAPGETILLDVAWDDKLPSIVERTGFQGGFHMVGQWFPKIARLEPSGRWAHFPMHRLAEFYADFGTYDVTIDVPAAFTIGATGPVVEARIDDGRRVERHVQANVHDFAFTAYDAFETRRERMGEVDVTVLYPKGFAREADREVAALRFALPHFGALYGAYPYPTLTVVHPPAGADEAGGMEYPTLITTGGDVHFPPLSRLVELITIHELGHQWFYGLVATDEVSWPFLDEGVNSFAEAEALSAWLGPGSAGSAFGFTLDDFAIQSVFGNDRAHDEPVAQAAYAFRTGDDYARLVYERTGAILETMRRVYGPEALRALSRWARRSRYQHPSPEDFISAFEASLGPEAALNLRIALFDEGWVDYAVTAVSSRRVESPAGIFDKGDTRETIAPGVAAVPTEYEGWALVTRRGTLSFPVDVELTAEDGSTERVRWNGEDESTRIPYRGKVGLRAAVVDPDHAILLDEDPTNNHASTERGRRAPRVAERLTYWAELWLQALAP